MRSERLHEARAKLVNEIGLYGVSENKGMPVALDLAIDNLIDTAFADGMGSQREGDRYYDYAMANVVGEVTVVVHDGMSDFIGDKEDIGSIVTRYEQFKCETWIPEGTYYLVKKETT